LIDNIGGKLGKPFDVEINAVSFAGSAGVEDDKRLLYVL
jgi:hypothetical protein